MPNRDVSRTMITLFLISMLSYTFQIHTVKPTDSGLVFSDDFNDGACLLGYWKFDEGSGDSVLDSSGNGNNGTNYGGTWVQGKIGYALKFDGTDDYVSIPTFTIPTLTSVTVAAWINSPLTQIGYVFYNGENGEFLLHNGQRADAGASYPNLASFSVKFGSVGWVDVYSNAMSPNSWHYIVGVWTKGVSLKIYVDGALAGENDAMPDEYLFNPGSGYTATIGRYYISEPDYFQGSIDEIKICNRALSAEEIAIGRSDNFDSEVLDSSWTVVDPDGGSTFDLTANPGWLRITTVSPPGRDLLPSKFNSPRIAQSVYDDFAVETKISSIMDENDEGAGILVWTDSANYVRLDRMSRTIGHPVEQQILFGGSVLGVWPCPGDTSVVLQSSINPTYLRLVRSNNTLSGYYSSNGVTWNHVGDIPFAVNYPINIGLAIVSEYHSGTFFADFDYFRIVQPSPEAGLVGYWKFDEGKGTIVTDSSGNDNYGILNGPAWIDGKYGKALRFDGVNDYVEVPRSSSLDIMDSVSITAWVYPKDLSNPAIILTRWYDGTEPDRGIVFQILHGLYVRFGVINDANLLDIPFTFEIEKWYYLAATWNGSFSRVYVNGVEIGSRSTSGGFTNQNINLGIGGDISPNPFQTWFDGAVDNVMIYNRALSAEEIARAQPSTPGTAPTVDWSKSYGSSGVDVAESVIQISDGGYALAGSTQSFGQGGWEFWLVKTDGAGNVEWNKTYGGTSDDYGYALVQTSDGGYAILGDIIVGGYGIAWLVKTDADGNMQWNKSYTEIGMQATAWSLIETNDGGYAMAGCKEYYDGWLMKTDVNGTMQWSRSLIEVNNTQLQSVVQTSDGGYIAAGATQSPPFSGKVDAYVVKTDSDGNITWSRDFSRTAGNDYGRSVVQTGDGGYAIAGETDHGGNADFWLVKIDASGNFLWDRTYGGTGWDGANSLVQTSDGGYDLAGQTNSFGAGGNDFWLVKTDTEGDMQWNETYGGAGDDGTGDLGSSVVQTRDGGYALTGYTNSFGAGSSDFYVVKLAPVKRQPRTWTVDDNGPADFQTIQEAINAASEGDTIYVRKGTYNEHLIINESLTLVGEDRDLTVVDGSGNGEIADIQANNVYIGNFTLQNAGIGAYGAVWVQGYSNAVICNNTMIDNHHGVGVWTGAINATVSGNLIYNRQPSYADGIRLGLSSGHLVTSNTVINESTGIGLDWTSNNIVRNNTVVNCYIGIGAGNPSYNNTFSENTVSDNSYGFLTAIYDSEFFHNNIINNSVQATFYESSYTNGWDDGYPSGGNFWSDYTGIDANADGIGDTPYVINANNKDNYPLVKTTPPAPTPTPPVANFTFSPSNPIIGVPVTFDGSYSLRGWNGTHPMEITLYTWDFGDGNSTTGQIVNHKYLTLRNYTVTLNTTDSQGLWSIEQRLIQVGQPHGPKAQFTTPSNIVHVGDTVEFNASASLPGWNGTETTPITEYLWDFGDGNITSVGYIMTAHSYTVSGTFNVTLTVFDSPGLNSSCSETILVIMPTYVSISTSSTSSVVGFVVGINGSLYDVYGNSIKNETVVLYYTFLGIANWVPMASSITDDLGHYSTQWLPTATGSFQIMAQWVGNTTHSGSSNTVAFNSIPYINQYVFTVESNSTISALAFNSTGLELSFTASGPSGTSGYVRITVAKSLVADIANIKVYLDTNQTDFTITSIDSSWLLTFNYTHSTHKVTVDLDINVIPEFAVNGLLLLLGALTALIVVVARRRFVDHHTTLDRTINRNVGAGSIPQLILQ